MDAKIKALSKKTKSLERDEARLLKEDMKRDKFVAAGKKALHKKK